MLRATRRALLAVLGLGVATTAMAHEIHTTHTTVTANATGYTLTIRAFADDLSASVARFSGRPAPKDSSVTVTALLAYVQDRLVVTSGAGKGLAVQSCGLRRVQEVYLVCLAVPDAVASGSLRLGNQLLSELHTDQVNIVQCDVAGTRHTHLFLRGRAPSAIVTRGRCASR
jgi:hypothetical protein